MMKKLLLLFALLFATTAGLSAQTSVYTQNFDSLTAGAAVSGFTNTGTCSWVVGTTTPVSSPNSFGPATSSAGNACGEAVYTGGPSLADSQLYLDTFATFDSTGHSFQPGFVFRSDGGLNGVILLAQWVTTTNSATQLKVTPFKEVAGAYTGGTAVTISGLTISSGEQLSFRVQLQGTTWSLRVWQFGTTEPGTWTGTGSIPSGSATVGYDGIYSSDSTAGAPTSGNTAIDDLTLYALGGMSPSPAAVYASSTGNTITLTGYGTSWVSGTTTFSLSGGTGASITATTVTGTTAATITVSAGTAPGTLTISDSTDAYTTAITVVAAPVTIPVTNANWYFSPYNSWSNGSGTLQGNNILPSSTEVVWNNPGAYFKTVVTTTGNIWLNVSTSNWSGCAGSLGCPQVKYSIDSGAFQVYTITGSETQIPLLVGGVGAGATAHTVLFIYMNTPQGSRWSSSGAAPPYSLTITGLTVDASPGTLAALSGDVALRSNYCIFYGDSITEGIRTEGFVANPGPTFPATGDAQHDYVYDLAQMENCEYGEIGFSGDGYTTPGSSGAGVFPNSWPYYFNGQSRLVSGKFSPMPTYTFINEGTNDGSVNIVSVATTTLQAIRAALNISTPLIMITPFNGSEAANIASAIVATGDPFIYDLNLGSVAEIGVHSASNGASLYSYDGLHPTAYNHGRLAALLAQALQRLFPINGQTAITIAQ